MSIGRLRLEYDGSLVVCNEVVGKIQPDCLSPEEVAVFHRELVRRWNHFETGTQTVTKDGMNEIYAHLQCAISQSIPEDDQIIMGHVRDARDIAKRG